MIFQARNENEEGYFVANMISELVLSSNSNFGDMAVLYRANYQSRAIEDALHQKKIGYVVKKGVSFYQREEIKRHTRLSSVYFKSERSGKLREDNKRSAQGNN